MYIFAIVSRINFKIFSILPVTVSIILQRFIEIATSASAKATNHWENIMYITFSNNDRDNTDNTVIGHVVDVDVGRWSVAGTRV